MSANPFLDAIEVIEKRGWGQGFFDDPDDGVCSLGALGIQSLGKGRTAEQQQFIYVLHDAIGSLGYRFVDSVWAWNDAPERTEEDVILALKHAAVIWDARA